MLYGEELMWLSPSMKRISSINSIMLGVSHFEHLAADFSTLFSISFPLGCYCGGSPMEQKNILISQY